MHSDMVVSWYAVTMALVVALLMLIATHTRTLLLSQIEQ